MVLRTFSPTRAWRPAVVARLARTLGVEFSTSWRGRLSNTEQPKINAPAARANGHPHARARPQGTRHPGAHSLPSAARKAAAVRSAVSGYRPSPVTAEAGTARQCHLLPNRAHGPATTKCSWLALRAAVLRLAVSSSSASPLPPPPRLRGTGGPSCSLALPSLHMAVVAGTVALLSYPGCANQQPHSLLPPAAVIAPISRQRLTLRSRRGPTAGRQARAGGTVYIFTGPGLASCRWSRLSSNVRRHTTPTATRRAFVGHRRGSPAVFAGDSSSRRPDCASGLRRPGVKSQSAYSHWSQPC